MLTAEKTLLNKQQLDLVREINELKRVKNAVLLCHNYQLPEVYEVADAIGDSLMLSMEAAKTDARIIVFSGVHFMAETAKILNPDKKVLLPNMASGCAMSDMIDADKLVDMKTKFPNAKVVTYINSSAEVKAESDVICTSSNAVEIVRKVDSDEIIMAPDINLAKYVASQVPEKTIHMFDGYCPIHHRIDAEKVKSARANFPDAVVIAHPECRPEVLDASDYVCSTNQMIETVVENSEKKEFVVMTECGMVNRLLRDFPDKKFYSLCNMCFDMKKNSLVDILAVLKSEAHEIEIDEGTLVKAKKSVDAMFDLMNA